MPLKGTAKTSPMGTSLEIAVSGRNWNISIRRVDGATDQQFYPFHGKTISENDIKTHFLPNWKTVNWIDHALSPGFGECLATDPPYQIHLTFAITDMLAGLEVRSEFASDLA